MLWSIRRWLSHQSILLSLINIYGIVRVSFLLNLVPNIYQLMGRALLGPQLWYLAVTIGPVCSQCTQPDDL